MIGKSLLACQGGEQRGDGVLLTQGTGSILDIALVADRLGLRLARLCAG